MTSPCPKWSAHRALAPLALPVLGWALYLTVLSAPAERQYHGEDGLIELAARGMLGGVLTTIICGFGAYLAVRNLRSSPNARILLVIALGLNSLSIVVVLRALLRVP